MLMRTLQFFAFLLAPGFLFAQLTADSKVEKDSFDKAYLESLIFDQVNEIRNSKDLGSFIFHEQLQQAAANQSDYQRNNKKLTHDQKGKLKEPRHRVEHAGMSNAEAVGENVFYTFFNSQVETGFGKNRAVNVFTYGEVAWIAAQSWKHSKPHYANIIDATYNYAGVSVAVDWEDEMMYFTQVFANLPGEKKKGGTAASASKKKSP